MHQKFFGEILHFANKLCTNIFDGHALWYIIECDCNRIMSRLKMTLTQWLGGAHKLNTTSVYIICFRCIELIVFKHSNFKLRMLQLNYPTRRK